MRILLVDAYPERAAVLEQTLLAAGHHIVAHFDHGCDLREEVLRVAPDMVIIDIDSPNRDILEDMHALNREQPRPVVPDSAVPKELLDVGQQPQHGDKRDQARPAAR